MSAAALIEREALPLDEDSEQGYSESQAQGDVPPGTMVRVLGVANLRERGEGCFDEYALVPGPVGTDRQMGWIALLASERRVSEDERVEGAVVGVGGVRAPGAHQPPLIEDYAKLAADDPAVVGHALAPNPRETVPALFAIGVCQLHAIVVSDAEDGRLR